MHDVSAGDQIYIVNVMCVDPDCGELEATRVGEDGPFSYPDHGTINGQPCPHSGCPVPQHCIEGRVVWHVGGVLTPQAAEDHSIGRITIIPDDDLNDLPISKEPVQCGEPQKTHFQMSIETDKQNADRVELALSSIGAVIDNIETIIEAGGIQALCDHWRNTSPA